MKSTSQLNNYKRTKKTGVKYTQKPPQITSKHTKVDSKSIIKVSAKDLDQHLLQTWLYEPFEAYLLCPVQF